MSYGRSKLIASTDSSLAARLAATTQGFQAALAVGAGFAAIGILVAVLMIREQECHHSH